MKRRQKIFCGLILLVAVGAALWFLFSRENGSKQAVEAYKQELRAQGEKLTIAELVPTPPAEPSTGAQAFMNATAQLDMLKTYPPTMKDISPGVAMIGWQQEIAPMDGWSNIWPVLSAELQTNRGTLSNLLAALNVSVLYFKLDYSQGIGLSLPHLAKLRYAGLLLSVATVAALHERNFPEAWANLHAATSLIRLYRTEPIVLSHLSWLTAVGLVIPATWEILQSDQWTDAQLAGLQSDWAKVEFFNASEDAFEMERAADIDTIQICRKSHDMFDASQVSLNGPSGLFDNPKQFLKDLYNRFPGYWKWRRSWSYDEELCSLQDDTAAIKTIRSIKKGAQFAPAYKDLQSQLAHINEIHAKASDHYMLGSLSDSELLSKVLPKFADTESARRLLVTAIALKRYHLRHGNYPGDLNALIPEFLPQVPLDFMDGKPLRYHSTPGGNYLLYSLGEDGEDNGGDGTPVLNANNKSTSWLKGRDIVWPRPATAEEVAGYYKTQAKPAASPPGTNATGR